MSNTEATIVTDLLDQLKEVSTECLDIGDKVQAKAKQVIDLKYGLYQKIMEVIPPALGIIPGSREISLGKNWMITVSGISRRTRTGMSSSDADSFVEQIDAEVLEPLREQLPILIEEFRKKAEAAKVGSLAPDSELETLTELAKLLGIKTDQ